MSELTEPRKISLFRLKTLLSACQLEVSGMRRRGRPATAIAKELIGSKARAKWAIADDLAAYIRRVEAGEITINERGEKIE